MFVIKIFSDFCDSTTCKINFEKTCDSNNLDFYGLNKKVYITDKDDYTHAIILNKAMPICLATILSYIFCSSALLVRGANTL